VTSQNPFLADYNALAAGSTITFSGADHNGNAVSSTFTKTAGDTAIGDFLTQIGTAFGGTGLGELKREPYYNRQHIRYVIPCGEFFGNRRRFRDPFEQLCVFHHDRRDPGWQ